MIHSRCSRDRQRNRSPRDRWYATYLVTFTFTQLIDIALWLQHAQVPGGLRACAGLKEQLTRFPPDEQWTQYVVSKFAIPLVVFSQHAMQLTYPSEVLKNHRGKYILTHALPLVGMCFQFACSDIVMAKYPTAHETVRWGGHSAETWQVLCVSGLVAFDFWLLIDEFSVMLVHVLALASVMSFLWATEGTLALGSKWCTYCLIYSFVYVSEPLWGPPAVKVGKAKKSV